MKSNINLRVVILYVFVCIIAFVVVSRILIVQRLDNNISSVNIPKFFEFFLSEYQLVVPERRFLSEWDFLFVLF